MMLSSMTAYGRAKRASAAGECTVEIHSVNKKYLDIITSLPKEFLFLDMDLRKWIQEDVQRGQVNVRVSFEAAHTDLLLPSLKRLKAKWVELAKGLGYHSDSVDFRFLTDQMEKMSIDVSPMKAELKKAVQEALKEFLAMRRREGETLAKDLRVRSALIEQELKKIEKKAPQAVEKFKKKLKERLEEAKDDERLVREVVLFAEKVDITEEITRLFSHLKQFKELLTEKGKAVGRTLEFLMQEMGREINTLCAKAAESDIVKIAVTIRAEIDKMREQVQNIE